MFNEKCNCGLPVRYSHGEFGTLMSCNKYSVCPTYDDLIKERNKLRVQKDRYEIALKKIVSVNAMDYEYQAWTEEVLDEK